MNADSARRLVMGKLFAFTCFDGSRGAGRIYADGSVIASYEFDKKTGGWTRHLIFQGEPARNAPAQGKERLALRDFPPGTAGTGLQMAAVDIDRDGDLDLVCPGKSGLYLFENLGSRP